MTYRPRVQSSQADWLKTSGVHNGEAVSNEMHAEKVNSM